jgi:hypothetical protein
MNEFINRRKRSITVRPAQVLQINSNTNLLIGFQQVPADDADFIQFENNHEDDHWDNPDKEYNEREVN